MKLQTERTSTTFICINRNVRIQIFPISVGPLHNASVFLSIPVVNM